MQCPLPLSFGSIFIGVLIYSVNCYLTSHTTYKMWLCYLISSVVDPNRLCLDQDPDPGSHVHSDPAPDLNRIGINSDPVPT